MNLLALLDLLAAAGLGVVGESLFVHSMPLQANRAVMLRQNLTGTPIDHELPGFYKSSFQVIVRTPTYKDGESLAKSVMAALTLSEAQIGDMYVRYCRPVATPVPYPLTDGNMIEHNIQMSICFNSNM